MPQSAVPMPEQIVPMSEQIIPMPEQIIPMPEQIIPMPEQIIPMSEQIIPMSEQIIPMSEQIVPMPQCAIPMSEQIVPMPQCAVPISQPPGFDHATGTTSLELPENKAHALVAHSLDAPSSGLRPPSPPQKAWGRRRSMGDSEAPKKVVDQGCRWSPANTRPPPLCDGNPRSLGVFFPRSTRLERRRSRRGQ